MKLVISNCKLKVEDASQDELAFLDNFLSISRPKFIFRRGEKPKYDGTTVESLFDPDSHTCAAGHWPHITAAARKAGHTVVVDDQRKRVGAVALTPELTWLRDYQRAAIDAVLDRTRGILDLATGAGKGEIATGLFRAVDARWLFLVDQANLMRDVAKRVRARAAEHGLPEPSVGCFGDGDHDLSKQITCATFQGLGAHARLAHVKRFLASVEAVAVDEVHTIAAASYTRLVMKLENAYWRVGLSGTPLARGDKRSAVGVGLTGPVIYQLRAKELVDRGVLSACTVKMVKFDTDPVITDIWPKVRKLGIVDNRARNNAVVWAATQAEYPALVFVDLVEHGEELRTRIRRTGRNCELVWGNAKTSQRAALIEKLERGDIDVLISSPIFDKGADIPSLRTVIMAAGGQSVIKTLQRIGRGMRKAEGKSAFTVWDFVDKHHRILANHCSARRKAYKVEGHTLTEVQAPAQ